MNGRLGFNGPRAPRASTSVSTNEPRDEHSKEQERCEKEGGRTSSARLLPRPRLFFFCIESFEACANTSTLTVRKKKQLKDRGESEETPWEEDSVGCPFLRGLLSATAEQPPPTAGIARLAAQEAEAKKKMRRREQPPEWRPSSGGTYEADAAPPNEGTAVLALPRRVENTAAEGGVVSVSAYTWLV
ncbi:hypothetical protein MRX96_050707 [Rhipicephalus microplus]